MKKVRNSKGLRSKVASSADPAGPTPKPEAPGSNPGRRTKKEHHPLGWCSFLVRLPGLEPGASGLGVWLTM